MASLTTTETSVVEKLVIDYKMCRVCGREHEETQSEYLHNNNNEYNKKSIYDLTRPKNEPKFMSSVRNWEKRMGFVTSIKWTNAIGIILIHVLTCTWFAYTCVFNFHLLKWQTVLFEFLYGQFSGFGVTGGAHRLWSHRSYKARWPMKVILLTFFSAAGQNTIYEWIRDHRVHHKHSDTDADPHNVNRGFFFSHVGWLMMKKHPEVIKEGHKIDMSDITNDPLVRVHTKYFSVLKLLLCYVIPTVVPVVCWGDIWSIAIMCSILRYIMCLNSTWSVNSFAHIWGNKPYDRSINPTNNWAVSVVAIGEGWHNYHHTFPGDYKTAELPYQINVTTLLIDFFATLGWVYDRKSASDSLISAVIKNRGSKK